MSHFQILDTYKRSFVPTGDIADDVIAYLTLFGFPNTAAHCAAVAAEAKNLATRFGGDPVHAEMAGYLHDISAVIPNAKRIEAAHAFGLDILPEETGFPMIVHQKLSVVLAREIFQIRDEGVLSAIGCHTTLKAGATHLDKIVFLADKIAWDQVGKPAYIHDLRAALTESLDAAVMVYLDYLWSLRESLRVVHPWFVAAREEMIANLGLKGNNPAAVD